MLHEHIGEIQHNDQNHIHGQDQQDAPEHTAQDGAQGSLHLVGAVKHLPDHGDNSKGKAQNNANNGHTPVNAGDGAVFEKDIGQKGVFALVADLDLTGERFKELIGQRDQVANG